MKALLRVLGLVAAVSFSAQIIHAAPKKILFFSKSSGYEHDRIKDKEHGGEMSDAGKILKKLGEENNIEFTFSKDGGIFTPENIAKFDAFFFYTTEDLTTVGSDGNPPMSKEGKAAFLQAIHDGKGFIGTHSAADTFHSPGYHGTTVAHWSNDGDKIDPYIQMLGGEFIIHGSQQKSHVINEDKSFPGMSAVPDDFARKEEWYSLKNFAPNLHVLLVQDTSTMNKTGGNASAYDRPNYPSTWAHMYGKGRVFYTSMGHLEEIWTDPVFQSVLVGGIKWAIHDVDADVTPNLEQVAPQAGTLPAPPSK